MSGALIIGLIVVVWLFVLAPLVLRGYRPIRRTNDAFEETRVVVAGGDTPTPPRKRPRFSAEDVRATDDADASVSAQDRAEDADRSDDTVELEGLPVADGLIDDPQPLFVSEKLTEVLAAAQETVNANRRAEDAVVAYTEPNPAAAVELHEVSEHEAVEDADVDAELPYGDVDAMRSDEEAEDADVNAERPYGDVDVVRSDEALEVVYDPNAEPLFIEDIDSPPSTDTFAVVADAYDEIDAFELADESEPYYYDDAYMSPADFLDPDADYEFADDAFDDDSTLASELSEEIAANEDLTDEDLAFAARRRGRGGYDPEVDAAVAMSRYQRRQRTLATLVGVVLISVVVGFVFGGWFWTSLVISATLTVLYLYALRRHVRAESALRTQRIRHMRRARLGVRNAVDEKLGIPERLRRPGAIVIELDDESPDFVNLDTFHSNFGHEEPEVWEDEYVDTRRVG